VLHIYKSFWQFTFKGIGSQDEYFLKACKINSEPYFLYMRKCFLTFLACPVQEKKKNIKFLLASLKTATNSKISGITFFSEQLLQSGGYPKAEASSLTSVIIRIFIISYFIEAERNFFLYFLHKKTSINCENLQRSFQKCCFDFQDLSIPKAIHLVNYPFKRKFANAEEG
jgi:hypothetical protein